MPFAPELVLPAIEQLAHEFDPKEGNAYGNTDNPNGWVSPLHYGVNEGPVVL